MTQQKSTNSHHNEASLEQFKKRVSIVVVAITFVILLVLLLVSSIRILPLIFITIVLAIFLRGSAQSLSRFMPVPTRFIVIGTMITLVIGIGLFGLFAGPRLATELSELAETIPEAINQLDNNIRQYEWGRQLLNGFTPAVTSDSTQFDLFSSLTGWFSGIFSLLTNLSLVLVAGVYMAYEPSLYSQNVIRLFPIDRRERIHQVISEIYDILRRWLMARIASMIVIGSLTITGLMVINMPLALTLGVTAGLLSFIPNLGPILSALPAILVGLTVSPTMAVIVALLYSGIQMVENYFITPMIERKTVSLPPALTMLTQIFFALFMGWLGLFIAAPAVAVGIVLVKSFYIEDVLGDKVGPIASNDQSSA